ncbi:MAG TPA: hemolysin family protein [bacterium]|nr:hemolysin family protein [bacterium]
MSTLTLSILLISAVAVCAFFSVAESALFSLGSVRLRRMKLRRQVTAPLVRSLLARPRRLLVTIVIGNMFALTAASAIATALSLRAHPVYGPALAVLIMTAVIFVFAETLPKTLGIAWPEKGAAVTSPLIKFTFWLFYPFNRATVALADYLVTRPPRRSLEPGVEDIYGLLKESEAEGVLDDVEREMIERVVAFADRTAGEIATPRTKIFALSADVSFEEAKRAVADSPYARIPVYEDTIENVVGILYAKDIMLVGDKPPRGLRDIVRSAHYVPDSQPAVNLFVDFIKNRTHIALVVDEYGALDGLVTMTDVLSEIVGPPALAVRYAGSRRFVLAADTDLEDFNDFAGANLKDDEAETLGGYLLNRFGHIPAAGEEYRVGSFKFTVERAEPHRVAEVLVEKLGEGSA